MSLREDKQSRREPVGSSAGCNLLHTHRQSSLVEDVAEIIRQVFKVNNPVEELLPLCSRTKQMNQPGFVQLWSRKDPSAFKVAEHLICFLSYK